MKLEHDENAVQLRLAQPADAAGIASVLLAAFEEFRPLYTEGGFAATTPAAEEIIERLQEGPIWVALHGAVIAGTVSMVLKGSELYVRGMAVLPAARGHTIGQALLVETERYASTHSCRRMFLSTTPFLSRAIRLYEKFGFRRTGEGPHELFGTPLFTMEKLLTHNLRKS